MDKKQAILDATLKLINNNGIHNAPMSKIAKEANVATGTLYHYFSNKQELIDELYTSIKIEMNSHILKGFKKGKTEEELLYFCWRYLLDFYIQNPMKAKLLQEYSFSSYISKELIESNLRLFDEYTLLLKKSIQNNFLKNIPMSVIMSLVIGPIKEIQYQHQLNAIPLNEQIIEKLYETIMTGLKSC